MLNLIKNEIIKLTANKKLYVGMFIILIVNLLPLLEKLAGTIVDIPISGQSFPLYMLSTYLNLVMPIFISVLIADMVTDEYANGLLTLSLIHPISRAKLLKAKVLALIMITALLMIYAMIVGLILGSTIFGWGEHFLFRDVNAEITYAFSTGAGLMITLGSYAVSIIPLIAFAMVIMFLALRFNSGGALTGTSIGIIIFFSFIGEIAEGLRPFLINNYFTLFKDVLLSKDFSQAGTALVVLGAYTIMPFTIGLHYFTRKDIVY